MSLLSSLSTPPPGSGHSSVTIFIYDDSVSPGTHSLLHSSEHQSIKNLRPFSQVWMEGGKFAGPRISRQPSACQIPFDAELMARAARPVQSRLSLSRAQNSEDYPDIGLDEPWSESDLAAHYLRSNQQFKCQFRVKTSRRAPLLPVCLSSAD